MAWSAGYRLVRLEGLSPGTLSLDLGRYIPCFDTFTPPSPLPFISTTVKKELPTLHIYTSSTNLPICLLISAITPSSSNLDRPWPIPVFTLSYSPHENTNEIQISFIRKHPREYIGTFYFRSLIKEYTFAVANYLIFPIPLLCPYYTTSHHITAPPLPLFFVLSFSSPSS